MWTEFPRFTTNISGPGATVTIHYTYSIHGAFTRVSKVKFVRFVFHGENGNPIHGGFVVVSLSNSAKGKCGRSFVIYRRREKNSCTRNDGRDERCGRLLDAE